MSLSLANFLLKASPSEGKADNKTSTGGRLIPNVATMVANSLPREGQPKPDAVLLACCDERFEQAVANPARNSMPRIFQFDTHTIAGSPTYNAEQSPSRHASNALVIRLKKTRSMQERMSGNCISSETSSTIRTLLFLVVADAASDAAAMIWLMRQISAVGLLPWATLLRSANSSRIRPAARKILVASRFT
jgi:hypothetical protein